MMSVKFSPNALDDFWYLYDKDKKAFEKLRILIKDTQRNGTGGIGKPECLTGDLKGKWSKRIDDKNRVVFIIEKEGVIIYSCRGHYDDK